MHKHIFLVAVLVFLASLTVLGQQTNPKNRRSPIGMATYKKGDFYAKVTYGRPKMKYYNSYPFGFNVPWRKIWRTGDDDATELTITQPVMIDGKRLEAGTYALFTVPDTAQWTVILNSEPGQWGLYNYNPGNDVLRDTFPSFQPPGQILEFTILLEGTSAGADLFIMWDRMGVKVPMAVIKED